MVNAMASQSPTRATWAGGRRTTGCGEWRPSCYCPALTSTCCSRSAHANNQHAVGADISGSLAETSFAKAMRLANGTVSVVDADGVSTHSPLQTSCRVVAAMYLHAPSQVSWTRIWW